MRPSQTNSSSKSDAVRVTWLEIAGLLLILLVATVLRIGEPGITEFKADEANLSLLALDFANGGDFPLLGIGSSVGFPNAPVNVYLLALPYFLDSSPISATVFVGLLNVMAVLLVYVIARPYAGPVPALLATLLYAVSPWAIVFSRKIWAQNMLPPFVLLTLWVGLRGFVQGDRRVQAAYLPLIALTGQIHYGAFVVIPAVLALPVLGWRHVSRWFWGGLVLAVICVLPFIVGLARADLLSADQLGESLSGTSEAESTALTITNEGLRGAAVIIAGTETHSLAGPERFRDFLDTVPNAYPIFNLLAGLVTASALWLLVRVLARRDQRTPVDIALLLLLVFPVLAFSVTWTPFFIHYLIPIIPVALIVVVFGLHDAWQWLRSQQRVRQGIVIVLGLWLLVMIGLQGLFTIALLDFVDETTTPGGFGTPLHYLLDVRDSLLRDEPEQVIGRLGGPSVNFGGEDRVWEALLFDVPTLRFEHADLTVFPLQSGKRLLTGCASSADAESFGLRDGEGCYRITEIDRDETALSDFEPVMVPSRFENGVVVAGFDTEVGESEFCVRLLWEINAPTWEDYIFAVHFFAANDERIAIGDGLSWRGRYWQPGDQVVRRYCVPLPERVVERVEIGMYTLDGDAFNDIDIVDENGAAIGRKFSITID